MIEGKKRFLLFPPETSWEMKLYPYLHPRATKSQLGFLNDPEGKPFMQFPHFEAVLEKGDVLYLPPLWFHQVESLESSISISMWTPSLETERIQFVIQRGIPNWPVSSEIPQAAIVYLERVLSFIFSYDDSTEYPRSPKEFVQAILHTRYTPLYESVPALRPSADFPCPVIAPETYQKMKAFFEDKLLESEIVSQFLSIPKHRRAIWLADYCEIVLNMITTRPELVSSLLICLSGIL
jgi:hypothetical protein